MKISSNYHKKSGLKFIELLFLTLVVLLLFRYISAILKPKYSNNELQIYRQGLLGGIWEESNGSRLIFIGSSVFYYNNDSEAFPVINLNFKCEDCLVRKKEESEVFNLSEYLKNRNEVRNDKPIILKGSYKIGQKYPSFNPYSNDTIKDDFRVIITWSSVDNTYIFDKSTVPPITTMDYLSCYIDYKKPVLNDIDWNIDNLSPEFVKIDDVRLLN